MKMSTTILYQTRNNNPETGYKASVQPMVKTAEGTKIISRSHGRHRDSVSAQLYSDTSGTAGSCIICVGSTGAGKSSTVTKFTGVVTRYLEDRRMSSQIICNPSCFQIRERD